MEQEDDVTANKYQIENAKVSFWEKMVFWESVTQIEAEGSIQKWKWHKFMKIDIKYKINNM